MSGGSYNYLFHADASDINERQDEAHRMIYRLQGLGFDDAANETQAILDTLFNFQTNLNKRINEVKGVWEAVEWMDSGDSDIEYVKEEIKIFRKQKLTK